MGGSVCRQVCKRQIESGDALDVLADAPKCRGLQEPAPAELAVAKLSEMPPSPASTADETSTEATASELMKPALLKTSDPTSASPEESERNSPTSESSDAVPKGLEPSFEPEEECERDMPMSESLDAVPKGLEPSAEPILQPLSPIPELAMDRVSPVVEPPAAAAKSSTEQEAAGVPPCDVGGSRDEHPVVRQSALEEQQQQQQKQQQQTDATGTMLGEMPTQARQDMHVDSSHEPQQKGMPSIAAVAHAQAFAKALNEARKKKKISPSQLAQRIGRKSADVRDFESGAAVPSDAVLTKMNRILNTQLPQVEGGTSNVAQTMASVEATGIPETAPPAESEQKQNAQARTGKGRSKRRN
jgi:ribosome-binding protein aMBF1 (putative translation factor)